MGSIPRKPLRAAYHCSLALLGLTCLLRHGRCSSDAVAIGAISRSLARGYARDQGRPHSKQSLCLQSGRGTRIVAQPRRISLVLHIGREALDKLARTTRGAHRSRPGPALPRYRTAGRILRLISGRCVGAVFNCSALEFGAGCPLRVNRASVRFTSDYFRSSLNCRHHASGRPSADQVPVKSPHSTMQWH